MSTEPHKFWPPVGSTWQHWSDLLLATQLAALRAGFNYVGRNWAACRPAYLSVRCTFSKTNRRKTECKHALVRAEAVDARDPSGAWKVIRLKPSHLDAVRHPGHTYGLGLSSWLTTKPAAQDSLKPGNLISGFRELHTMEGSLRADARREGRFIRCETLKTTSNEQPDLAITCILEGARCPFLIKLNAVDGMMRDDVQWICVEIRGGHTCTSAAPPPSKRLARRLDFFPPLVLKDGHLGKKTRMSKPSRLTPRQPSPELFAPIHRSPGPSPPPLASSDRKKALPAPARTPPAPTSSVSPSPAPARARAAAPEPPSSPARAAPAPAPAPAPAAAAPPSRTPSALLARRLASLASATSVLAALEQALDVQRALVDKKRRSVERAERKAGVRRKSKMLEVVEEAFKKPVRRMRERPTKAERKRLKLEAQARRDAE
ncbi:hypothetical protein JCM8208_006174 [Rhodotorula glutinis]